MNYYMDQLSNIKPIGLIRFKFINDENKTNWMNLNKESIRELQQYLKSIKSKLK